MPHIEIVIKILLSPQLNQHIPPGTSTIDRFYSGFFMISFEAYKIASHSPQAIEQKIYRTQTLESQRLLYC